MQCGFPSIESAFALVRSSPTRKATGRPPFLVSLASNLSRALSQLILSLHSMEVRSGMRKFRRVDQMNAGEAESL